MGPSGISLRPIKYIERMAGLTKLPALAVPKAGNIFFTEYNSFCIGTGPFGASLWPIQCPGNMALLVGPHLRKKIQNANDL